jgi:hypothetical protein
VRESCAQSCGGRFVSRSSGWEDSPLNSPCPTATRPNRRCAARQSSFRSANRPSGVAGHGVKCRRELTRSRQRWFSDLERNTERPASWRWLSACRSTHVRRVTAYLAQLRPWSWPNPGGSEPGHLQVPDITSAVRLTFDQEEQTERRRRNDHVEGNITPAYCACQERTTTYCYFTPLRRHPGGYRPDSRTIDRRGRGFNAHFRYIAVEGCGFVGKVGLTVSGKAGRALDRGAASPEPAPPLRSYTGPTEIHSLLKGGLRGRSIEILVPVVHDAAGVHIEPDTIVKLIVTIP